ncbi:MAG: zf-HC2 domain-containing protein [Acidobacteria bacterium]|nr:zf-HC2 domain-containing protein [Acidobacteriota bacterium]
MTPHERERLSAWLDGELPPAERAEVEGHLAACEECAALLADLGAVDGLARELPAEPPAGYLEGFPARVRARIEGSIRARGATPPPRWRIPVWTWAAAAVLVLAVVTPLTLERLDHEAVPARQDRRAQAPKEAPEIGALSSVPGEADEAVPADRDREPEQQAKREVRRELRLEERAREPEPAFAVPPAPEPTDTTAARPPALSRGSGAAAPPAAPESGTPGRWTETPSPEAAAPVTVEGEAREEVLTPGLRLRGPVAKDDVATGDAALEDARVRADAPAKGRMAAPRTVEGQGGLAAAEKKTVPGDTLTYARLARRTPSGAAAWRAYREDWRAFVEAYPGSRHVDEARVRVIEAGLEAWHAGGDPEDLTRAQGDADAYLARDDAGLRERVLRALSAAQSR